MTASGLIKFDMEELESLPKGSEISKAELVLRVLKTQGKPITDVFVTDSPWEEMTVTGSTPIEVGEKIGTWEAEEQFGIMTMDITEFLARSPDKKMLSFYLTIENSDGTTANEVHVQYYTKDQPFFNTTQPPTIRIEYNYDSDDSEHKNAQIFDKFLKNDYSDDYFFNDWGTAGYKMGSELPQDSELSNLETFHVSSYGAEPNQDGVDDYLAIQSAIDAAAEAGGGIIQFDSGTYDINIDKNEWNTLSITASNIILRGRGDKGDSATIIKQHETTLDVQAVATKHLINVGEGTNTGISSFSSTLVKDVTPGDNKVQINLNTRVTLEPGDKIALTSYMEDINGEFSRAPLLEALKPLPLDETWTIRNGTRAVRFANTITDVKEIDSDLGSNIAEVTVATPFPYEFKVSSGSDLRLYTQRFENVGVESLQIKMIVPDSYAYAHHKVTSDYNYDYGNGGIRFHQVKNSWVRNVTIHNFLMDLSLSNSLHNTVDNVTISGVSGHHGIGYYGTQGAGSYHNLVQNIEMNAVRTHAISYNQSSGGNVLRNLSTKVRNDTHSNAFIANIDFHGGVLGHNLVEQSGQIQINSAGAWTGLPHSGPRNVLWNVTTRGQEIHERSGYAYENGQGDGQYISNRYDHYRLHPKTIVVGAHSHYFQSTVDRIASDQKNDWFYVEAINQKKPVYPLSLYEAQKSLHQNKEE